MGKCRDRAATIHANNDSGSVGMNIKRISRCAGSQTRQSANLRHPPLSASLPAAFVNDPYGSHGGNWSAYGGNFVLDTFHYVSVASLYVQGQLVGGEFHSDFFGPLGPLVPFHVVDWGASQIIPNGNWIFFACSVNSGCN